MRKIGKNKPHWNHNQRNNTNQLYVSFLPDSTLLLHIHRLTWNKHQASAAMIWKLMKRLTCILSKISFNPQHTTFFSGTSHCSQSNNVHQDLFIWQYQIDWEIMQRNHTDIKQKERRIWDKKYTLKNEDMVPYGMMLVSKTIFLFF